MCLDEEKISMVQECTDSYEVTNHDDGSIEIHIKIPKEFKILWKIRLSDMTTTVDELEEYKPDEESVSVKKD